MSEEFESGHDSINQVADEYSSAFNEATTGPEEKEASQGSENTQGSWIPEEKNPVSVSHHEQDGAGYTPETVDHDNPPENLKDHPYYKSIKGRIDIERKRADEYAERLKAVEAEKPAQQRVPQVFEKADIHDDIKEDVASFKAAYPEYADVIEMKGKTGDRIRRLLSDYGVEVAAVQADNFILKMEFSSSREELSKKIGEYEGSSFEQRVYAEHPDVGKMQKEERSKFINNVRVWIEDQPLKDARKWERIYEKGSASELSELFSEYKNSKIQKTTTNHNTNRRQQAIDNGLAVPSSARGATRSPQKKHSEDYSEAFNEACES